MDYQNARDEILGKAEFLNPGGQSRTGPPSIIREAEADGSLRPGGTIVEGTAGNTGIGLALVGGALGYEVIIVMPRTQSQEKKDTVRAFGATLIEVDAAPFSSPNHFVHYSRSLAERLGEERPAGAIWANQFDNLANRRAHERTTAPELWDQTQGKIDAFYLRSGHEARWQTPQPGSEGPRDKNRRGRSAGASLYSYYTTGTLASEGSSITEGIGVGRITGNLEGLEVDYAYRIEDDEALAILFDLVKSEGLSLGGSAALNLAGAVRIAEDLGPGHTIVTMLCDLGTRYASRLFNTEFLSSKGLPTPPWIDPA